MSKLAVMVSGLTFAALAGRAVAIGAQPTPTAPPAEAGTPPAGPGLDLINERCGFCHNTAQVFKARKTAAAWATTVQAMADRGAEVSADEQKVIVEYLAKNYGVDSGSSPAAATVSPASATVPPAAPTPGRGKPDGSERG